MVYAIRLDYYLRKKGTACVSYTNIHATTCTIHGQHTGSGSINHC